MLDLYSKDQHENTYMRSITSTWPFIKEPYSTLQSLHLKNSLTAYKLCSLKNRVVYIIFQKATEQLSGHVF